MGKKLALAAGAVLALALLLVLVLGFRGWDATDYASEALQRFDDEAGWTLEAESARLVPFGGLTLSGVTGTTRIGGSTADIAADEIRLEHRPGALLSGRLELERMTLLRPVIQLAEPAPPKPVERPAVPPPSLDRPRPVTPPKPPEPEPEPVYEGPVSFAELGGVEIVDGALVLARAESEGQVRIEGLQVSLDAPSIAPERRRMLARALSAKGRWSAERVELPVGSLEAVDGELLIEQGRLILPGLTFSNQLGDFRAEVDLQLGTSPLRHTVELHAEPLDLHALFESPETGVFGEAKLDLKVSGAGSARESLQGQGKISLSPGRLPSFPILNHLEAGLRRVNLHQAQHGPLLASFAIGEEGLQLRPFSLTAAELRIEGEGSVGYEGELDLELVLSAEAGAVSLRGVPDDLVELMTVRGGRLSIPVVVTGTTDRPRARADADALVERARQRGQIVDRAALDARLDELFGLEG